MTTPSRQDFRYVESVVKQARSSFAIGMKALPKDRRGYLFAIYAYCRILDDIADGGLSPEDKRAQLDIWQGKIDRMLCGQPECEITRILAEAMQRYTLPKAEFYQLLDGMRTDACGPVQPDDWTKLHQYCRQVAVSVGLLSLPIFGRTDNDAQEFAIELGYALQLTNILRDVAEDNDEGRIYLPKELMQIHDAPDITSPNLPRVLEEIAVKTREHYQQVENMLATTGTENLTPAILMKNAYYKLFLKMERRGWQHLRPRMRLSTTEKALLVMESLAGHG